ncbi:uncharacterized protein G2W53_025789 [Senna tora]|uniref:Late embryogenesis abundant protein n=1 Tax=Senna tora TaxID=362788 RepID=A0A834TMV3_9FABA|nr:uncharacterized protein G2W53_025789 [Senna tora]
MHRRAQASVLNVIYRYPFRHYPKPISSSFDSPSNPPIPSSNHSSSPELPISSTPTSRFHSLPTVSRTQQHNLRNYTSGSANSGPELDTNKEVDMINLKFAEAREEIEMALESKETVYFNEEAECARAAVSEVLRMFEGLLGRLPESERAALQRSMGLKIEQLKAELKQLDE